MARLVMLTKDGNESGFAISPSDFDTTPALDGDGEVTWKGAGYKLGHYEDTREPYKAESPRAAAPKADEKK
jgi:hypothetical protein